jgi:NADP-dependent 3-hydroxy acid dehydrogenase YdfG
MAAKLKGLYDQVIVLTGASSAVGLCTAQLASRAGAKLVLVARNTRALESLVSMIGSTGGDAMSLAADVSVRDEVTAVAKAAVERFGRIDTWVNNAGISIYGRLDEVSEAESRHLFDINFWGVVNGSLAALPHLLRTGGALVNVGSEAPGAALPMQGMYASSKHAVRGFTEALRAEFGQADHAPVAIALVQPVAAGGSCAHAEGAEEAGEGWDMPATVFDPMELAQAILLAAVEGVHPRLTQPFFMGPPEAAAMLPAARPSAKQA